MRLLIATITTALLFAACGGDSSAVPTTESRTADIDVCALLTPEEISSIFGEAMTPEASEPAGPFTGCSWDTGDLLLSIATTTSLILAPGEDECPSVGVGEVSHQCEGRGIKFLIDGIHVSVSTINGLVTDEQLLAAARAVETKLGG